MPVSLPAGVARWLEGHVGGAEVVAAVGGGCVNPSVRVRLAGGDAFLKFNTEAPAGVFEVESEGLRALRSAAPSLRVPEVLGVWEAAGSADAHGATGTACLLLEWLEPARPAAGHAERLGRGLAEMHRAAAGGWGWERDGFIGPLPQSNRPAGTWAEFWWSRRLEPQLRCARDAGRRVGRERDWSSLERLLPPLLAAAEADGPSLLHGDLWSGNVLAAAAGSGTVPALVDPAVYRGHREVDLAMAALFGGFDAEFFRAYREAAPLQPGSEPGRRAAYQLFYLLVHVNLFGASYLARTEQALRDALAAA